ncbi:hypothetical protein BU23DRAFT_550533 [Bimuria novae-zelandiae CBS 107.79]|uniref:F-box domain-containing protein n=1 Tax=Bimuria novae-zelandiae CBS 107.79 TaxID=1447943 RepID=A0A6A5VKV8_9PLEO|nr:hypothetical protein BU23DRAFT_550533 [Bimuria novae-zelandiae CBS 107.79]
MKLKRNSATEHERVTDHGPVHNRPSRLLFSLGILTTYIYRSGTILIQPNMATTFTSSDAALAPPILRLPVELHQEIISHLVPADVFDFRKTNRYFHRTIAPISPTLDDLLCIEKRYNGTMGFACKHCLCVRPQAEFSTATLRGKTGPNGGSRYKRFCAECGFNVTERECYSPGARAVVKGPP